MMKAVKSIPNVTEEELIAGILNNDQQSFSEMYELYSGRLFGLIIKWVKEQKTAEILLCKSFIKAWQERLLFDPEAEAFYWWLCKQARICYHEYPALQCRNNL